MSNIFENTVSATMLALIKRLSADARLSRFRLVGGTALALQMGHRKSIDIDMFTDKTFPVLQLFEHLHENYSYVQRNFSNQGTKGNIGTVKCDFFNHNHQWINEPLTTENIRMASAEEIAAMKIYAIIESNGARLKDFVDIAFLSGKLSVEQMLNAFCQKYRGIADTLALKSLFFYDNIDFGKRVDYINRKITWLHIQARLDSMQQHTEKIFEPL